MKLNGWMRLWLLFSAIWLALIGIAAYSDVSVLLATTKYQVSKPPTIGNVTFVFSRSQVGIQEQIKDRLIPEVEKDPTKFINKTITAPYDTYVAKHLMGLLARYVAAGLMPVALLLLLGYAVAWVRHGFRASHA